MKILRLNKNPLRAVTGGWEVGEGDRRGGREERRRGEEEGRRVRRRDTEQCVKDPCTASVYMGVMRRRAVSVEVLSTCRFSWRTCSCEREGGRLDTYNCRLDIFKLRILWQVVYDCGCRRDSNYRKEGAKRWYFFPQL